MEILFMHLIIFTLFFFTRLQEILSSMNQQNNMNNNKFAISNRTAS